MIEESAGNCDWLIRTIESKGAKTKEQTVDSISRLSAPFECSLH